ncbi:MAG: hypothetical protein WHU94_06790 [Thermogemmata sp.]|uniref:Type IV pilus assembly protein PilM n=1 Tax=Thermogemmata fonticola TaxID=2755323 RepID=A0A7V8VCI8_9BACT|nr:hypothetical protein [Thermogemmata fonticola]MBA2225480.1 hypothetical protein [Thermogemmata fonticola]
MARYLALDLTPDGILLAAGSVSRLGQVRVDQVLTWTEAEGTPPPPLTLDTATALGEQLRQRLKDAGIAPAPVLVAVGRGRVILKELRYPAVPPTDEPNVVKYQAIRELSESPDDVVIDYTPLSNGVPEGERRSMAVILRKDLLSAIQKMCSAAGLKLLAVTPRPYAVAAELGRAQANGLAPQPETPGAAVATLLLSPVGGEFTVVRNGEVQFTRDLPAPVFASESTLLAEVRRNLTLYTSVGSQYPLGALHVYEADGRYAPRLRAALPLPVHAHDPLQGFVLELHQSLRGRCAALVGLLVAQASRSLAINFVQPRQPQSSRDPYKVRLVAVASLAALLLFLGGVFGYWKVHDAEREIVQLQRRKQDLENEVKLLEPDAKRLDAVRKWQARGVNWLDELYDWSDRFPHGKGVHATQFLASAIPPDSKTGKQPHQAKVELKFKAPDNQAATHLYSELHYGEAKYYAGVRQTTIAPNSDYAISANVNARPPQEYTRAPEKFTPPDRRGYPPSPSTKDGKEGKGKNR